MREKQPSFFKTSESVAESDWELASDRLPLGTRRLGLAALTRRQVLLDYRGLIAV